MSNDELPNADKKVTKKKDASLTYIPRNKVNHTETSDATYRSIVEECEAMMFTHDLQGRLLTINDAALTNLAYKAEDLESAFLISLIPEKKRKEFTEAYLAKLKKDGAAHGTLQLVGKNGKKHTWLYHNNIFDDRENQPFVICFAQDITDRVEEGESLRLSNETFRSAFDYSGIGMALISPQGHILDANKSLCSLFGYNNSELTKLNFLYLNNPD